MNNSDDQQINENNNDTLVDDDDAKRIFHISMFNVVEFIRLFCI